MSCMDGDAADWPQTATSRLVGLEGTAAEVHYLDFGGPRHAPVVVCVHGLGGSALNFGLLGTVLAGAHRVLALDLLSHGRSGTGASAAGDATAELRVQVEMVGQFIRQVVGEPVVLIGHSLGGVVAMLHAVDAPEGVHRLVLIGPPVPRAGAGRRDGRLTAKLLLLRAPGVRSLVARTVRRSNAADLVRRQLDDATPHAADLDPAAVTASVEETKARSLRPDADIAQRHQWDAILGTISVLATPDSWHRHLDRLRPRVLWLHGEDDLLSPIDDARAFLARHPGWTVQTRSGVGHLPHLEDSDWTASVIAEWLSSG